FVPALNGPIATLRKTCERQKGATGRSSGRLLLEKGRERTFGNEANSPKVDEAATSGRQLLPKMDEKEASAHRISPNAGAAAWSARRISSIGFAVDPHSNRFFFGALRRAGETPALPARS
ncbi:MAG: hypothetical protein V3T72_10140, partial [Thermoanaerobaculia bacterium]